MAFLASLQQDVVIDACEKMQNNAMLIATQTRRNEFLQQNLIYITAIAGFILSTEFI
jgi:hypothetical protein